MAIIISKDGKGAKRIDKSGFALEDKLQAYIYENPEAIPVYEIKDDIKLLVAAREFATASGPIDALGFDQEGNIYIVETKLYKNADKRTVVAQALDYGASLWRSSIDFTDFITQLDRHTQQQFKIGFSEKIQEFFGLDDSSLSQLLDSIRSGLAGGNFKFVILMNKLHDALKDLIVFINRNSQFDVYAVELEYYKHQEFEILIPKLYGAEVKKEVVFSRSGSTSSRRTWTEEMFWQEAAQQCNKESYDAIKLIADWAHSSGAEMRLGTGAIVGSLNPMITGINGTFLSIRTNGRISINLGYLKEESDRKRLLSLLDSRLPGDLLARVNRQNLATQYPELLPDSVVKHANDLVAAFKEFAGTAGVHS